MRKVLSFYIEIISIGCVLISGEQRSYLGSWSSLNKYGGVWTDNSVVKDAAFPLYLSLVPNFHIWWFTTHFHCNHQGSDALFPIPVGNCIHVRICMQKQTHSHTLKFKIKSSKYTQMKTLWLCLRLTQYISFLKNKFICQAIRTSLISAVCHVHCLYLQCNSQHIITVTMEIVVWK